MSEFIKEAQKNNSSWNINSFTEAVYKDGCDKLADKRNGFAYLLSTLKDSYVFQSQGKYMMCICDSKKTVLEMTENMFRWYNP